MAQFFNSLASRSTSMLRSLVFVVTVAVVSSLVQKKVTPFLGFHNNVTYGKAKGVINLVKTCHMWEVPHFYKPGNRMAYPVLGGIRCDNDELDSFDCATSPWMCQEPFNCQDFEQEDAARTWAKVGVKKSSMNPWCSTGPRWHQYARACIAERNMTKASLMDFELSSVDRLSNGFVDDLWGTYCFHEQHCVNQEVTENMTELQLDMYCDTRLGTEWRDWPKALGPHNTVGYGFRQYKDYGFEMYVQPIRSEIMTKPFTIAACVMGNLACDIATCKNFYCKEPAYQKNYIRYLQSYKRVDLKAAFPGMEKLPHTITHDFSALDKQ